MGGAENDLYCVRLDAFSADGATIKYSSTRLSVPKGSIYWPFEVEIRRLAAGLQDDCFYALRLVQRRNHNIYYGKLGGLAPFSLHLSD